LHLPYIGRQTIIIEQFLMPSMFENFPTSNLTLLNQSSLTLLTSNLLPYFFSFNASLKMTHHQPQQMFHPSFLLVHLSHLHSAHVAGDIDGSF